MWWHSTSPRTVRIQISHLREQHLKPEKHTRVSVFQAGMSPSNTLDQPSTKSGVSRDTTTIPSTKSIKIRPNWPPGRPQRSRNTSLQHKGKVRMCSPNPICNTDLIWRPKEAIPRSSYSRIPRSRPPKWISLHSPGQTAEPCSRSSQHSTMVQGGMPIQKRRRGGAPHPSISVDPT